MRVASRISSPRRQLSSDEVVVERGDSVKHARSRASSQGARVGESKEYCSYAAAKAVSRQFDNCLLFGNKSIWVIRVMNASRYKNSPRKLLQKKRGAEVNQGQV
jgi:hypothetical protein